MEQFRRYSYRFFHGGAGNRTLVRVSFQNRFYVRRLDFLPSLRIGIEPTSPKPISLKISLSASERRSQPARFSDSVRGAPGGLHRPKEHKRA